MAEQLKQGKVHDLIQDDRNLNKGTERGQQLIEKSLRQFGAGRSILVDKNNRIIAGNKTHANAEAAGIDDAVRKSFYSVICMPSSVKVSMMGKNKRLHHNIEWNNTAPKIIAERFRKV